MASKTAIASPIGLPSATSTNYTYQPTSPSARRSGVPPVAPPRVSSYHPQSEIDGTTVSAAKYSYHEATKYNRTSAPITSDMSQPQTASRNRRSTQDQPPCSSGGYSSQQQQQQHQQYQQAQAQYQSQNTRHYASASTSRRAPEQSASSRKTSEAHIQEPLLSTDQLHDDSASAAPTPSVMGEDQQTTEQRRNGRSAGRNGGTSKREKNTKFNNYILGNVIGEGEFGKVRLGWKQTDSNQSQVAIKIIKKESLGNNPNRLAKIHREVNILRSLQHSNIVRLYDMISDDTRIGIVLEYASGGELFDYILRHRYLKDNNAKRLFAQLVSGVGYLHKKGIVHRDLKLENLLLDRNKNIIITDFGFANTFDSDDVLSETEEERLADRDFVKSKGLDRIKNNGHRRGDLMQTSCGSPCYAAPELVVSDCLYTGRKVDVWSCGVILYAMLAGYLPFDDDPANPEGDNINLLYKYIVNTTLTFPEYVSPHARDLLRRILVPDPRKRADLFEVARHSWLSDYESAVAWITSNTTSPAEVQQASKVTEEDLGGLSRSVSVRESSKKSHPPVVGGLAHKSNADGEFEAASKASKRRTVQVEYVAPATQTQRGVVDYSVPTTTKGPAPSGSASASRHAQQASIDISRDKPLPKEPTSEKETSRPPRASMPATTASSRPTRDNRASTAETLYTTIPPIARPQTGSGILSTAHSSYSQPAPPTVAGHTAQGRIQQPKDQSEGSAHPNLPPKVASVTGYDANSSVSTQSGSEHRGHKRSNTMSDFGAKILGRSGSIFGNNRKRTDTTGEKTKRKYPPLSMSNNNMVHNTDDVTNGSRQSIESSRRSISFGLGKKHSGSIAGSQHSGGKSRRYSLIAGFRNLGIGSKNSNTTSPTPSDPDSPAMQQQGLDSRPTTQGHVKPTTAGGHSYSKSSAREEAQYRPNAVPQYVQTETMFHTGSESSFENGGTKRPISHYQPTPYGEPGSDYDSQRLGGSRASNTRGMLQKPKRGFQDQGAARTVMDFFRRRGKAREAGGGER